MPGVVRGDPPDQDHVGGGVVTSRSLVVPRPGAGFYRWSEERPSALIEAAGRYPTTKAGDQSRPTPGACLPGSYVAIQPREGASTS